MRCMFLVCSLQGRMRLVFLWWRMRQVFIQETTGLVFYQGWKVYSYEGGWEECFYKGGLRGVFLHVRARGVKVKKHLVTRATDSFLWRLLHRTGLQQTGSYRHMGGQVLPALFALGQLSTTCVVCIRAGNHYMHCLQWGRHVLHALLALWLASTTCIVCNGAGKCYMHCLH